MKVAPTSQGWVESPREGGLFGFHSGVGSMFADAREGCSLDRRLHDSGLLILLLQFDALSIDGTMLYNG